MIDDCNTSWCPSSVSKKKTPPCLMWCAEITWLKKKRYIYINNVRTSLLELLYGWRNGLRAEQLAEPSQQVCDSLGWQSQCCRLEVPESAVSAAAAGWSGCLTSAGTPASKKKKGDTERLLIPEMRRWVYQTAHLRAQLSLRWALDGVSAPHQWTNEERVKGVETLFARAVDKRHCSC